MQWVAAIREAVNYIEESLFDDIGSDVVARSVYSSSYHFQRIFSAITGVTISEYIRNRRLSLIGAEIAKTGVRVIDAAYKCGYDTPESFAKAFQRFHGFLPSGAAKNEAKLKTYRPISIQINVKGGFEMTSENPAVVEKLTFKPFGPYRFIGKGVVAPPGSGDIFGALWQQWEEIFGTLDGMGEYAAAEEPHGIAYMDGMGLEEYNDAQMWYIVGRFMKPGAPVPQGFVCRDIKEAYVGVGHMRGGFNDMIMSQHRLTAEAISAQDKYTFNDDAFAAEVYLPDTDSDSGGVTTMQYYISCVLNPDNNTA